MDSNDIQKVAIGISAGLNFILGIYIGVKLYSSTTESSSVWKETIIAFNNNDI